MSICPTEVDAMLMREWQRASANNRRAEMARLSTRAIDKVMAEMQLRGFTGFAVTRDAEGRIEIVGTPEKVPDFERRQL